MSIKLQNYVWELELPPHLKYVAIALADHAHDDGGEARPSQAYLSKKTGLSDRQLRRSLTELLERNVIVRERAGGRNRATTYAFVLPDSYVHDYLVNRRTSKPDRWTPTSVKADASVLLTLKNPNDNPSANAANLPEEVADVKTARAAIEAGRRILRGIESATDKT